MNSMRKCPCVPAGALSRPSAPLPPCRVYLLPPAAACAWVGLAYTGCDGTFACRAWIASGFWTSVQAIAHELGHNLGMGHAGKFNIQTGQPDPYG